MTAISQTEIRTPGLFVFHQAPLTIKVSKLALSVLASIAILALVKPPLSLLLASAILIVSIRDFLTAKDEGEVMRDLDSRPPGPSTKFIFIPREQTPRPYIPFIPSIRTLEGPILRRAQQGPREPVGRREEEAPKSVREMVPLPNETPAFWRTQQPLRNADRTIYENPAFKKQPQQEERVPVGNR